MLQQALNRHSQVAVPPETKFFYYFYGQSRRCQLKHLRRINDDLRINLAAPARTIRTPCEASAYYDEIVRLYVERLDRDSVECFGDKAPEHTGHLSRIHGVFPDAKIIFMYRDGRDVALSLSEMPWIRCDVHVGFVIWLYYYNILRRSRRSTSLDIHFVKYEKLVSDPAAELERLLRFLGLEYESQVAEGYGNHEGIPEREYAWKGRALKRITPQRIGVWRRQMSCSQIHRLERLGAHALTDLGYDLSDGKTRPLSPWFLTRLVWGIARCGFALPLRCLANELVGTASRISRNGSALETCVAASNAAAAAAAALAGT